MISEKLKISTKPLHDTLEQNYFASKLKNKTMTVDDYYLMLQYNRLIHAYLEKELTRFEVLHMKDRVRVELLLQDIELLKKNYDLEDIDIDDLSEELNIDTLDYAYGVLYVLEGSRMGGMVVSSELLKKFGESFPVNYFLGYKEKTIPKFLAFKDELNNANLNEEETLKGAKDTFVFFGKVFNRKK